ncbi:MAG: cell division regulator GpsB [Lactobacillaceae bacterium]|jgi:DivIVA domain-containing protein|nr:cell division regulator GpsB [Lactobacillaceae bacterium]
MENILHTRDDIFNKDFKGALKGYDKADVDTFLDEIMADYQGYENNISELQSKIKVLQDQVEEYKKQVNAASSTTTSAAAKPVTPASNTNMDILKRLSNLERRVFGTPTEKPATENSGSNVE